ncbi:MAG: FtsX-like permease family protein, partial [Lysinibacillus sp.]
MTFKSIVWKMARGSHRKYMTYFLCNSFTVMFFFMFATVYFNEQVIAVKEIQSLKYILAVPGVALIVFTVFFIQYAHDIFMKQRKSEFGLLASIGLSPRDIRKLVIIESVMISGLAVISGLIGGMVFSRFFFLLLMNAVGLDQVAYQLTWVMIMYPVVIYLFIYWLSVGISLYSLMQLQHTQNMKSEKMAETVNMKSPYFGIAGVCLLVFSIGGLYITYSPQSDVQELLYLWAFFSFIGLYLCIANFTVMFTRMVKGMPSFYYRHVLLLSSAEYKMKRLSTIGTLVAVMVMVTLLYGTILLFTAGYERERVIAFHPYDIGYMETETPNKLPASELKALVNDFDVQERLTIPIHEYVEEDYSGWERAYSVISIDAFNAITGRQETLTENEFIYFINEEEAYAGDLVNLTEFTFKTKTGELLTFNQKE